MKKIIKKAIDSLGFTLILRRKYSEKRNFDYSRLKNNYVSYKPLKLHFGCGPRIIKGWVNIDIFYTSSQKYLKMYTDEFYGYAVRGNRADLYIMDVTTSRLPLPDSSVDVIFHEDFLEHLSQRDQFVFLSETYRVLKKGGIHRVNTPDLLISLKKNSDFTKGGEGVYTGEWDKNDHKSVLTKNTLEEMVKNIGYKRVVFNKRDGSMSKEIPKEFRPMLDGERDYNVGNIFADLIK